jgi:hypothetical protein
MFKQMPPFVMFIPGMKPIWQVGKRESGVKERELD